MAGIYLHIPFCKTRCIYCDFYSTTRSELKTRYVQALCRELTMRKEYLKGEDIETIYLVAEPRLNWKKRILNKYLIPSASTTD